MAEFPGPAGTAGRQPALYLPHGGGPCFFMEWDPPGAWDGMRDFLASVPKLLAEAPKAIVVASAHAEADPVVITAGAAPALLYDYGGFPPHTFGLTYPVPGHPGLAAQVRGLLAGAGITATLDDRARFDHGVFIP